MRHKHTDEELIERLALGRVRYERTPTHLTVVAPGARNVAWIFAAVLYGVPWLVTAVVGSVWYLGWGVPGNALVRIALWLMTLLLTFAMHTVAGLSIWGAMYARIGIEEIIVDDERITVVRHAGRVPIELHINRSISEQVRLLPPHNGFIARPRIELKAWRSAIRFGAGLTEEEAAACVEVLHQHFSRAEAQRVSR